MYIPLKAVVSQKGGRSSLCDDRLGRLASADCELGRGRHEGTAAGAEQGDNGDTQHSGEVEGSVTAERVWAGIGVRACLVARREILADSFLRLP